MFFICPRQYASSCFSSALSSAKPARRRVSIPGILIQPLKGMPLEMICTASSFLSALSVKSARKRLWRGTLPEALSSAASRAESVEGSTSATMVRGRSKD